MKLPSKELMGEVLLNTEEEEICIYELCCGRTIRYSIRFKCRNNDGTFNYEDGEINIYELAHKCKEWANICRINGKNYQLETALLPECLGGAYCDIWSGAFKQNEEEIISSTEPEAIFKACEWLLEKTKCGY